MMMTVAKGLLLLLLDFRRVTLDHCGHHFQVRGEDKREIALKKAGEEEDGLMENTSHAKAL